MKSTLFIGALLLTAPLLSGCPAAILGMGAANAPAGIIYTDVQGPIDAERGMTAEKEGTACAVSILALFATGDASIEAAKRAGGITEVATVDFDLFNVLGIYARACTIVRGT